MKSSGLDLVVVLLLTLPVMIPKPAVAQAVDASYSRRNTFTGFVEYSNDSSHIFLGSSENRRIGALGLQYQRRLLHRNLLDIGYMAEVRPVILESDPTLAVYGVFTVPSPSTFQEAPYPVTMCRSGVYTLTGPGYAATETFTCGRRTAYAQGFSPVGVRLSGATRHRLQPTMSVLGGYMFSPKPIPTSGAGSFNFTLEFGAGVEYFRSATRSFRLEYQIQHYSNGDTASDNAGVDSGFFKLTYAFGR
jgi:hypothetical protein